MRRPPKTTKRLCIRCDRPTSQKIGKPGPFFCAKCKAYTDGLAARRDGTPTPSSVPTFRMAVPAVPRERFKAREVGFLLVAVADDVRRPDGSMMRLDCEGGCGGQVGVAADGKVWSHCSECRKPPSRTVESAGQQHLPGRAERVAVLADYYQSGMAAGQRPSVSELPDFSLTGATDDSIIAGDDEPEDDDE